MLTGLDLTSMNILDRATFYLIKSVAIQGQGRQVRAERCEYGM